MPIYMDRHDVSETVTAEQVAQLHQEDLKIQDQFGCRGITYWFDEKRKTAFCLIEAPNKKALQDMHTVAHGETANRIIEVDPFVVESFLGRIEDPVNARNTALNIINDPAFRTIMVIELSPLSLNGKQRTVLDMVLSRFTDAVYDVLLSFDAAPVKQRENYFLLSFASVSAAVKTAQHVQALFHKHGTDLSENFCLKIGISAGVPLTESGSFFEVAVKKAEEICEGVRGEIIITSDVKDLYNSENRDRFIDGENIVALNAEDEEFLGLLIDFISTNWRSANLKVGQFCKPLGCSKSQLYRRMVYLTGRSPNNFINDYRLKRALKQLKRNEGNISEIAFDTGFSSASYFSKCFQKKYGHLPSDYLPVKPG